MIDFDYQCNECGKRENNKSMTSFICNCGGRMLLESKLQVCTFQPYFSEEMKEFVRSPKHEEKLLRKNGLSFLHDHKKLNKRLADVRKNKEDVRKQIFEKDGIRYEGSADKRFDITLNRFVPKNPSPDQQKSIDKDLAKAAKKNAKKSAMAATLALFIFCGVAQAKIDMVEYTTLEINGKTYDVPKANKDYVQELYWLKRALKGDKEALEIFVGNAEFKDFFIGDEYSRWVRVYKDGRAEVTEHPN